MSDEIRITRGYAPGAIGWVVELHGLFYGREWGFGPQFEAEVACELGEFFGRYNPARDGFWLACRGEKIIASLTLDHALAKGESSARVRWFIAAPEAQGTGVGSRLFEEMLAFAQNSGHDSLHLWTFDGLTAARRIYDRAGFVLTDEEQSTNWGPTITAQRMQR